MNKRILETERSIQFVKETFGSELSRLLDLQLVSSPIAILDGTGINDDLNGYERSVEFPIKTLLGQKAVVVNSLAKWKRMRLKELQAEPGKGIITDMRAIRPDEDYSPVHSIYVDQWDWEKCISQKNRTIQFLKQEVEKIYRAIKFTELKTFQKYRQINPILPETITFIYTEDLAKEHPGLTPKEREKMVTEKYGAVFLMGIGGDLIDGKPHDGRAPDYDDWSTKNDDGHQGLNGDIILWNPILKESFEISSMGIRVDERALIRQLEISGKTDRAHLKFHQMVLNSELPLSIGGGIGQSRLCMFMLRKKHIGEVQVGIWDEKIQKTSKKEGIFLL